MRIKVIVEYEISSTGYLFVDVIDCPDGIYGGIILEQEKCALINLISEKLNPGRNIKVEKT